MHRKVAIYLTLLNLAMIGGVNVGCISPEDYIKIIEEEEPKPGTVFVPEDPGDIPEQGTEPSKPHGSGGVISGGEEGDPGTENPGGSGGQVVIPDELTIDLVTPASGDVHGGYEVRVYGKVLDKSGSVQFGSVQAPSQTFVNTKVVRAVVPAGKPGCVDVIWRQDGETITLPDGFCYTQKLSIDKTEPAAAVENAAVEVELTGSGFDKDTRVYFSDGEKTLPLGDMRVNSESRLTGILPVLSAGKASVMAVNASGRTEKLDAIEILPALKADGVSPSEILVGSAPAISIAGAGFMSNTKLLIGGTSVPAEVPSPDVLKFRAPDLKAGSYDVLIWDDYRQIRLENALHYYEDDGVPRLFSVTPNRGSAGTSVAIKGVHLPDSGEVKFGGISGTVKSRSGNEWVASAPAHQPGFVDVAVGADVLKNAFEYVAATSGFSVKSIEPSHAIVGESTSVTLTGTGFADGMQVSFGPWQSDRVEVKDSTHAVVSVPAGSGTVPVQIVQNAQTASLSFTYDEAVSIVGMSPNQSVLTGQTRIEVYGTGFEDGMSIGIHGEKYKATVVNPGYLYFYAPAHDVGTDNVILYCSNGDECARTQLTWFDPSGVNTSASGGRIHGELHVTVLTVDTAVPIEGATVYIGSDIKTAMTGTTDENGRVSFFDDSLKDAQIVIACAPEHSCNTLQPVNASNITLFLEDWHADDASEEVETPPPPPPSDGEMINPIEITVPFTPQEPYFTGTVGSFGKGELISDPNLVKAGLVMQSALSPYMMSYSKGDEYLVFEEGGTYRIKARRGDVALALLCGFYDKQSNSFYPKYIGVKRHLFVNDGAQLVNHLECPLPLNQSQSVKLLDAPLKSGPNVVYANAYIFVGDEGYIGGFMSGISDNDHVVITKMPPLRDSLEESSFAITAGAYTNMGYPASVFNEYEVIPTGDTLEVGPAAPIPVFRTTTAEDIYKTGVIQWSVEYPQNVDFYAMTIRSYSSKGSRLVYQFYMPGSATSVEFPTVYSWAEDKTEQLYISLTAYKSVREGFDFNLFSTGDVRYNYIHSSASANLTIRDPALTPADPNEPVG